MKKIFFLIAIVIGFSANAKQLEYRLNTATTNLTTTFPSTPQLTGFTQITAIQVNNQSNVEVEVNCSTGSTTPTSNAGNGFHVPAGFTLSSPSSVGISGSCYLRSNSGTGNSGVIEMIGWGW